jgi:hypothetical protein
MMTTNSKEYNHNYYLKHQTEKLQESADRYSKNKKHLLDLRHKRYLLQRADTSKTDHERYIKTRNEVIQALGGKCVNPYNLFPHPDWCNDLSCLQVDHIHGGGRQEVKKFPNSLSFYKYVLEQVKLSSKEYQLLCANCNLIKRDKNREFRKKTIA